MLPVPEIGILDGSEFADPSVMLPDPVEGISVKGAASDPLVISPGGSAAVRSREEGTVSPAPLTSVAVTISSINLLSTIFERTYITCE